MLDASPAAEAPRQERSQDGPSSTKSTKGQMVNKGTQEAVNVSYIAIVLGIPLTLGLGFLYLRSAEPSVTGTPFFRESLVIYGLASFVELASEPCFAAVQQQMQYKSRALAETVAAIAKTLATCSVALWANVKGMDIGVLPFAAGQVSYALSLCLMYLATLLRSKGRPYSLKIRSIASR